MKALSVASKIQPDFHQLFDKSIFAPKLKAYLQTTLYLSLDIKPMELSCHNSVTKTIKKMIFCFTFCMFFSYYPDKEVKNVQKAD